jgi:hypothetical protein
MAASPDTPLLRPVEHVKLVDPLREVTRSERRNALAMGVILLATVFGGLVPKTITTLGITLTSENRQALVLLMIGLELYFIFAFWVYARADTKEWQRAVEEQEDNVRQNVGWLYSHCATALANLWSAMPVR